MHSLQYFWIVMILYSKRAREERALAAEQRVQALQGKDIPTSDLTPPIFGDEDSELEDETDYDRRRTLLEVIEEKELDALRATALSSQDSLLSNVGPSGELGDACGAEDSCGSTSASVFDQIKTSPSTEASTRPRKKRKLSQSNLTFTSHSIPAVGTDSEATKANRGDAWDCEVCTL